MLLLTNELAKKAETGLICFVQGFSSKVVDTPA